MASSILVSPPQLTAFAQAVYQSVGVSADDAHVIADSLVQADLWGHQSHGTLRLSWYLERLRHGVMRPDAELLAVRDSGAVAVLDGQHGIGQVIASRAMAMAIERAKRHGTCTIAIRNSNHFGTVMYYTRMAAMQGCIAFMTTNGGPAMAPWGGAKKKIIGTNPWSISTPAGSHSPVMLDIANTGVARGKIYLARQRHESIPLGWAIDAEGAPTTDPDAAIAGLILPMAEHKGYAIAALVDVLSGVLPGAQFLSAVNGPYHYDKLSGVGHFLTVHDVAAFCDPAEFGERMDRFIAEIKAVPLAQGTDEIFYPGEMEEMKDRAQRQSGLLLPADTWSDLQKVAASTGTQAALESAAMTAA